MTSHDIDAVIVSGRLELMADILARGLVGRACSWRIGAARAIAHWAMRPAVVRMTLPLLRAFPLVLTESARTTGKVSSWRDHALDTWRQG